MSREDWTVVGFRLYGLYLAVGALLSTSSLVALFVATQAPFLQSGAVGTILQWIAGSFLLFRAEWIASRLDRRAR